MASIAQPCAESPETATESIKFPIPVFVSVLYAEIPSFPNVVRVSRVVALRVRRFDVGFQEQPSNFDKVASCDTIVERQILGAFRFRHDDTLFAIRLRRSDAKV